MSTLEAILEIDEYFFRILNSKFTHPWLDTLMPILTDLHKSPIMLYLVPIFLVLWLVWHRVRCLKTILGIVVAVALADATTYHLIKKNVQRERPEKVMADIQLKTHSHSGYSFPSNHTANVFAGALIVRYAYPGLRTVVYLVAILVGYSRIYLGVHFPLDVFAGGVIGTLCGFLTLLISSRIQIFIWKYSLPDFAKKHPD